MFKNAKNIQKSIMRSISTTRGRRKRPNSLKQWNWSGSNGWSNWRRERPNNCFFRRKTRCQKGQITCKNTNKRFMVRQWDGWRKREEIELLWIKTLSWIYLKERKISTLKRFLKSVDSSIKKIFSFLILQWKFTNIKRPTFQILRRWSKRDKKEFWSLGNSHWITLIRSGRSIRRLIRLEWRFN